MTTPKDPSDAVTSFGNLYFTTVDQTIRATYLKDRPVRLARLTLSLYADDATLARHPGNGPDEPRLLVDYEPITLSSTPVTRQYLPTMHRGIPVSYACIPADFDPALN